MGLRPLAGLLILSSSVLHYVKAERHLNAVLDEEDASYVVFLQTRLHGEGRDKSRAASNVSKVDSNHTQVHKVNMTKVNNTEKNHSSINRTSLSQRSASTKSAPDFGDYVKAFAALAAETTASVGDAMGGGASNDETQDEAVGTSAAVGATIGVVVGATVGV
eukprot:s177_g38.t1